MAIASAVLLAGCTAPGPAATTAAVPELTGRTAGAPQRCIRLERHEPLRVAGPHTLAYGRGRRVWINAVPECAAFKHSDVLVTDPIGTQLCRGDLVRSLDAASRIPGPVCRIGDFIPYTRG
jgi:hypothetical protein